ncbi:hypothetical protein GCM10010222_80440 [Streptomyces tanashiensis]|uniref:DUF6083 domain-containing protein n=1 Tax=Streptomyces tanashiensis TaxID=67367 RepID=UPI0016757775|nr:DUF6083 domain-containing protein [Streptomyces tanashiensis]GGT26544.1 hypothetical protein GCM10010222_80440 [Streptomyces tanashiensis]
MRSTHTSRGRHWDGSPHTQGRRRALRVAADSPTRLLRTAQHRRCRHCGNQVEWHTTVTQRPIPLHPAELPTLIVPAPDRWHVASGVAHHADDGTPWCRITHPTLCPAHTTPQTLTPALDELRRRLALRTRRLLDTGAFTPGEQPLPETAEPDICRPARPVVQLLYSRYLAARPVEDIQCVAQTIRRTRCPHPLLTPGTTPGRWTLAPATLHRTRRQLALPAADIAVYDLGRLPYSEQLRWRTQHCPIHATTQSAPDLALAEWEPFDPLLHHAFLATRLPGSDQQHR